MQFDALIVQCNKRKQKKSELYQLDMHILESVMYQKLLYLYQRNKN